MFPGCHVIASFAVISHTRRSQSERDQHAVFQRYQRSVYRRDDVGCSCGAVEFTQENRVENIAPDRNTTQKVYSSSLPYYYTEPESSSVTKWNLI